MLLFIVLIFLTVLILIPLQKKIDQRILEIKNQTISIIEKKLNLKISYSNISPSLFLYMEFRDFALFDNERELININRIRIYYNLPGILSGNALNSLKEIRIVKSEFIFDYEKDRKLIDFFTGDAENEKKDANFPELKISGRNLKIEIIKGTESIRFSRLFFDINHKKNKFIFNIKGNLKTVTDEHKAANVSSKFLVSGSFSDEPDILNTRIVFKSIENNLVKLNKLSLRASYKNGIFDIQKVEDARPLDLRLSYSTISRQLKGSFTSENFIPLDYFIPKEIDPAILQWLGTSVTGNVEFKYLIDSSDFSYIADIEAQINNELLSEESLVTISLIGDRKNISFSKLKLQSGDGFISFNGDIGLNHFLPSGNLYLSYNFGAVKINANIIMESEDNNLSVYGENITINEIKLFNFQSNNVFFEKDIDFNVSFCLIDNIDYKVNEDKVVIDGNFQYNPDFFLNLSINSVNTPLNSLIKIIPEDFQSYFKFIPQLTLSTELFVSTDFKRFSFSASEIKILSALGDNISFSSFGNNESIEINGISANFGNRNLNGSIKAKISDQSIRVFAEIMYEELPYTINLKYYPENGVSFEGKYGLSGSFFKLGNVSEFRLFMEDFPLTNGVNVSEISMDIEGRLNNADDWKADINSLSISNIPGLTTENTLAVNGYISQNKISLASINYTDTISSLNGSGNLNYNIYGNKELNGNFSLLSSEEELYQGTINLLNKEIYFNFRFNNTPLNRFENVPLSGFLNGEMNLTGLLPEPNISLTFQLENGEFNLSPIEIETSIVFNQKQINLTYLRLSYMNQIIQKGNGTYNLNTGEFLFGSDYIGLFDQKQLSASLLLKGNSIPFNSRHELNKIFTNDYNLLFSFTDILVNSDNYDSWDFKIKRSNETISFGGGPENSISGSLNDDGSFSIISKNILPLRGTAQGSVQNNIIDLSITDLEVDLSIVNLVPIGRFVEFTGGTAFGYLDITGPVKDPFFNGILHAKNVNASVPMVQENIDSFDTTVIFNNNSMAIGPENLQIGNNSVNIDFSMIINKWLPVSWSLNLKTNKDDRLHIYYSISSIGLVIDGLVNGRLNIDRDEYGTSINSDLTVSDCIISLGPAIAKDSSHSSSVFTDMKFTTGRGVQFLWPSNTLPILRATADMGQVIDFEMDNLSRTYSLEGDIEIKYGNISYFQKSFYLSEGSLIFNENETKFDPLLDFRAQIREVDAEGQIVNISLILDKMPVSQFAPRFESDPPLSDIEIFSILGTGVFTQLGNEQLDLTSALLLTGDLVTQFGIIRNFEKKVKDIFNLDLFSIRTQMIQNILVDRIISNNTGNNEIYANSIGRYLDNTTLYLGKYFGDDIFLQALVQISTQKILEDEQLFATNELFIESSLSFEWQTPLFLLGFTVKPDFEDPESSIKNTSLELSWGYSY